MNIRMAENSTNNTFRFDILRGKKLMLSSKGYPDRAACLSNLEKTLHSLVTNDMLNVNSVTGGFVFQANHLDSVRFKSLEEASDAIAYLKEAGTEREGKFSVLFENRRSEIVSKRKIGTATEGYDFRQPSKTKQPGIELLDKTQAGLYYFHLNDGKGKPMVFSRTYDGKGRRLKAVRQVVNLVKEKKIPIKIVPIRDNFVFVIKDLEGYEIARSKTYPSKEAAEIGIKYFKKQVKEKIAILKQPKKKKKKKKSIALPKQRFLLKQFAPSGSVGFESFRSKENKCHYFHYHDTKGQILLVSQAFDGRNKRDKGIADLITLSQDKDRYIMKEKNGKHYFIIENEKGKSVAKSRYFETKRDMILGMKHFLGKAPNYLDQKNTITTNVVETIPIIVDSVVGKSNNTTASNNIKVVHTPTPAKERRNPRANKKGTHSNNRENKQEVSKNSRERPTNSKPNPRQSSASPLNNKKSISPSSSRPKKTTPPKETKRAKPPVVDAPLKAIEVPPRSTTKVVSKKSIPPKQPSKTFPARQMTSTEKKTFNWWPLLLLLIPVLFYFLWKSCGTSSSVSNVAAPVEEVVPPKNIKPVKEPVKKLSTLLGPNAKDLGYEEGSLAADLSNFLSLQKSTFPKTFLLDKVHFDSNQDVLKASATTQLDRIVQILTAYPSAQVQINGHTDSVGASERNLQLSTARAVKVKQYLVENEIAANRIATKGFGATQPLSTNQTETGKYSNRRSEIVLLKR